MRPPTIAALALALGAAAAHGQVPSRRDPVGPRLTVATNPIAPIFGAVGAEAELALGRRGFTVGVGGTYDTDRENLSWVHAKLKYYVARTPLAGLAVGVTAGEIRTLGDAPLDCVLQGCARATESAPMVGVVIDYNLLLGRRRRLLAGAGLGVQRAFADELGSTISPFQPDGRLVVGWAF